MEQTTIKSVTEILTTGHIIAAVVIVGLVWLGLKIIQYLASILANKFSRYRIQITGVVPLLRIVIWAVTLYVVIVKVFNPPQANLLAMLASTGLAVGLAAQDVIRNVISGALILFEQPFRVGDMVNVDGHYGEVKSIGLRSITLLTFDDNTITVPNATVTAQSVSNANSGALNEMVVASFLLPASVDIKKVKELAWEAAACSPYAYLRKPINVLVEDVFNRSFLNRFTVKAYVLDVRFERKFASDVIERVKQALLEHAIITHELVMSGLQANVDVVTDERDEVSHKITMDEKI
ncbi:mechanosensitive ion channel family protein [Kaarinaea lacus]